MCPDLTATLTFTDINGDHLLQLRVGLQDMAPPSVHPDTGERLTWDGLLRPLKPQKHDEPHTPVPVSADTLIAATRLAWTARSISSTGPARTPRRCRLAYARVLLETLGVSDADTIDVLEWACRLGGSDANGVHDVRRAVESTRKRLEANEHAVGGATIARLLPERDTGRRIVRLLRKGTEKRTAWWMRSSALTNTSRS